MVTDGLARVTDEALKEIVKLFVVGDLLISTAI